MAQELVSELHNIAGGLNIEGGFPYNYLVRDNVDEYVLWGNYVLVLDRPLIDNILFEELDKKMKENNYPLLENTIDEINEHQMFAIYLMTIGFYLEYGRRILRKTKTDGLHITVHIHQDTASNNLIDILKTLVYELCEFFNVDTYNTFIDYRTDNPFFISTEHNYKGTDILLSFSQCAGLDPELKPGDMLIPTEFVPYNIKNKEVNVKNMYTIENDVNIRLDDILKSRYHIFSVDCVNRMYESKNKSKSEHKAKLLKLYDFIETPILQVDDLWNPSNKNELVSVII